MPNNSYIVQNDDTLYRISLRFQTTVVILRQLNSIQDASLIYPGQTLLLPDTVNANEHPELKRPTTSAGKIGPVDTQLPTSGKGFETHNPDDAIGSDRYGTAGFVAALISIAEKWEALETVPVSYGDMSRKNGPKFEPHKGHRSGREVDIRPLRKDRKNQPTNWKYKIYDRKLTTKFMKLVKLEQPNALFYFNDLSLIDVGLCKKLSGHDDHIHLEIYD